MINLQPTQSQELTRTWIETLSLFVKKEVITMLFLGFSAGIPILLIFSSLSLWLGEAGVQKSTVTYFSWAALGYSFKFLWAPLVDRLPIPFLTSALGRRRGWLLFSQFMVISAIIWMGSTDPSISESHLTVMAIAVVMLGFSSATQDSVIDAYRIEIINVDLQSLMASTYIAGYRVGMIAAGAGALILAESFGTSVDHYDYQAWRWTYYCMALLMLIGVATTILISEPSINNSNYEGFETSQYLRFFLLFVIAIFVFIGSYNAIPTINIFLNETASQLFGFTLSSDPTNGAPRLLSSIVAAWAALKLLSKTPFYEKELVNVALIRPVSDFFSRYGTNSALLILIFVGIYRISDIVLGVISNVFYQDMGFSKVEIATASKTFGLIMTILGGFLGGLFSAKYGVMRVLVAGAVLTMLTNLLFVLLAQAGHNLTYLYLVISADNITGGLASTAFIAYLASLTNISFTAVQYAIFSSLMTLIPKSIGGYSGTIVESVGYENFFYFASGLGIPVIVLLYFIARLEKRASGVVLKQRVSGR